MPPHKMHRARLLCGMPLWRLPSLQVDHVRPPRRLATLGSELRQPPVQATLSPFVHLSKHLHLSLLEIRNREIPSQAEMSYRLLGRREMPFLRPSIFPAFAPRVPPCTNNRAGWSWMQGVAMNRMQQHNSPFVLRPLQFQAEPTLRFSRNLSFSTPKIIARDQAENEPTGADRALQRAADL